MSTTELVARLRGYYSPRFATCEKCRTAPPALCCSSCTREADILTLCDRLERLEAACAAMREALERISDGQELTREEYTAKWGEAGTILLFDQEAGGIAAAALKTGSGTDLLAELRALRAIVAAWDAWQGHRLSCSATGGQWCPTCLNHRDKVAEAREALNRGDGSERP
jgi:hypothetical protein